MNSAEVKEALRRRHNDGAGEWCCIEEAFSGFASLGGGIDLLAVGVWRSAKAPGLTGSGRLFTPEDDARNPLVAYEVKITRSDFRRELYGYQPGAGTKWNTRGVAPWPGKAYWALARTHFFMFATPAGLLHDDEIARTAPWGDAAPRKGALYLPEGIGLVEIRANGCHVRRSASRRHPRPWTRHETAELLRRAAYTSFARGQRHAVQLDLGVAA